MIIFRLLLKEIKYFKSLNLNLILSVFVGLFFLLSITLFKFFISESFTLKAKELLGADLVVKSIYPVSPKKLNQTREIISGSDNYKKTISFFSMVAASSSNRSILANIKVQEEGMPYYGAVETNPVPTGKFNLEGSIWVYQDVLDSLDIAVGESVKIGELNLVVRGVVTKDEAVNIQGTALAPKIYMSFSDLEKSSLVQKGSTVRYAYYFKTTNSISEEVIKKVNQVIDDSAVRVQGPKNYSMQVSRLFRYVTDFLSLIAILAYILTIICFFYLYKGYLGKKQKILALYNTLGIEKNSILVQGFIHVLLVNLLAGVLVCLLLFLFGKEAYEQLTGTLLPSNLSLLNFYFFVLIFVITSSFCLYFPFMEILRKNSPKKLFDELISESTLSPGILSFSPMFILLVGVIFYLCRSVLMTSAFVGGFVFISALFYFLWGSLTKTLYKNSRRSKLIFNQIAARMYRYRALSFTFFLTLFFSSLFVNLIPQLESSLDKNLSAAKVKRPNAFLFDIQEDQVEDLKELIKSENHNVELISPMIRGRLLSINDKSLDIESVNLTREEERAQRMRNRGMNLSYRDKLHFSEAIVEGKFFDGPFSGNPFSDTFEVSLEKRYSKRIGAKLGDVLTFEIMGMELKGKVTSIRKVNWLSFVPNFFVLAQPGVFENAPKTYLSAVSGIEEDKFSNFQRNLVDKFSNISSLSVERVITSILEIVDRISLLMLSASVLSSLLVVFVILFVFINELQNRKKDFSLLRLVGTTKSQMTKLVLIEFSFVFMISYFFGSIVGASLSGIISHLVFDEIYQFDMGLYFKLYLPVFLLLLFISIVLIGILRNRKMSLIELS